MDHILRFDFGYGWPWNYGHLVACGFFVALAVVIRRLGWPRSLLALSVALAAWAMAGFAVTQLVMRLNLPVEMPTTAFLRGAAGPGRDPRCRRRLRTRFNRASAGVAREPRHRARSLRRLLRHRRQHS